MEAVKLGEPLPEILKACRKVYFIGIGGAGMSSLARVMKHLGYAVSGSDCSRTKVTEQLASEGMTVYYSQSGPNFGDEDLIIYSSAIQPHHPELSAARHQGKNVLHRAQVLSALLNQAQTAIAVTGTHGKTTTTSMLSYVLTALGSEPTCLVGGMVKNFGTNTLLGNRNLWISEVDESDRTHELYYPHYAVVTNLEEEHMDHYSNFDSLKQSFVKFFGNLHNPGMLIYCADDALVSQLVKQSKKPAVSYGFSETADFSVRDVEENGFMTSFDVYEYGFFCGRFSISIPGRHNVLNSLAVIALLVQLGVDVEKIRAVIGGFQGAGRRLDIKWKSRDLIIVDDYAHHPTEIRASLQALRSMGRPLTVVFQPHRFSRTQRMYREFANALDEIDELILTDI